MKRFLLALFILCAIEVPLVYAAPLQPYTGPQDVSQLFGYLNQLINQINANAVLTSGTPGGNANTLPATNANGSTALGGSNSTNASLVVQTVVNAVNMLQISGAVSGQRPAISSVGTDMNIDLALAPQGTGLVALTNVASFVPANGLAACPGIGSGTFGVSPVVVGYLMWKDWLGRTHAAPSC